MLRAVRVCALIAFSPTPDFSTFDLLRHFRRFSADFHRHFIDFVTIAASSSFISDYLFLLHFLLRHFITIDFLHLFRLFHFAIAIISHARARRAARGAFCFSLIILRDAAAELRAIFARHCH